MGAATANDLGCRSRSPYHQDADVSHYFYRSSVESSLASPGKSRDRVPSSDTQALQEGLWRGALPKWGGHSGTSLTKRLGRVRRNPSSDSSWDSPSSALDCADTQLSPLRYSLIRLLPDQCPHPLKGQLRLKLLRELFVVLEQIADKVPRVPCPDLEKACPGKRDD